jgi:hypothetical protein
MDCVDVGSALLSNHEVSHADASQPHRSFAILAASQRCRETTGPPGQDRQGRCSQAGAERCGRRPRKEDRCKEAGSRHRRRRPAAQGRTVLE